MTRFSDLLQAILPETRLRADLGHRSYQDHVNSMTYWLARLQKRFPQSTVIDPLAGRSDLDVVWYLEKVFCLYRDRFLEIPLWYYADNPNRLQWCGESKEALLGRLCDPVEVVKVFVTSFWLLREPYEAEHTPELFEQRARETRRVGLTQEIWNSYQQVRAFLGSAFRPLMEAYKLYEDGEREEPLCPLMHTGGSVTIAASEVNRLVAVHLGVSGYNCLAGRKKIAGVQERCEVTLDEYSDEERQRVVAFLLAHKRKAFAIRLLLCELALRRIIPSGVYAVQAEGE